MKNKRAGGASYDAIALTVIKLVTTALGLIVTRLLSEHLSIHDYGTYSQILLVVSTVSSLTILGMADGMNYFYCGEPDADKKESYAATIFTLQCTISVVAGCIVLLLSAPLCSYFDNPDLRKLLFFAAALPMLQNALALFQILIVTVGKARVLAIKNFMVSLLRLMVVLAVVLHSQSVAVVLAATVVLDVGQIIFFWLILRKCSCRIRFSKTDVKLFGKILQYCAPMAVFIIVNSLNRDMDKYLISLMTDSETFALYANASKQLPFDILMTSFCTVLIPYITRYISERNNEKAARLYKLFLEVAYISTGILCCAALCAAPQLMRLLYSDKYAEGLSVFCIYILVDLFRFANITLVLSAAGKTRRLMVMGLGAMILNGGLNVILYNVLGIIGPAVATLAVTILMGLLMLCFAARVLDTHLSGFFDWKYLILFVIESVVLTFLLRFGRQALEKLNVHYFLILVLVASVYGGIMLLLNGRRLLYALKNVNHVEKF